MASFLGRPFLSEIQYKGQYSDVAFDLFATPLPVYRNLLKFLGKYGATLRDLRYDTLTLPDANISCTLLDLKTMIRFYLDRVEVTITNLHEVGAEAAMQLGLDAYAALQASDPKISLAKHGVTLQFHAELVKGTVEEVIGQYVTPPKAFSGKTMSGASFHLRDQGKDEEGASILIEPSLVKNGALFLRLSLALNATDVPLEKLRDRMAGFVTTALGHMGLEVERTT